MILAGVVATNNTSVTQSFAEAGIGYYLRTPKMTGPILMQGVHAILAGLEPRQTSIASNCERMGYFCIGQAAFGDGALLHSGRRHSNFTG